MDRIAQLDGSDTQKRQVSTQPQRLAAFKKQLGDAVLILDSLDPSSLNDLKQDEGCKDLVQRLLSIFPTLHLANEIDQVVKAGLEGIAANITRLSLLGNSSRDAESRAKKADTPASFSSPVTIPATKVAKRKLGASTPSPAVIATPSKSPSAAAVTPIVQPARNQAMEIDEDPKTVATIHLLQGRWGRDYYAAMISAIGQRLSAAEGRKYTVRESTQGSLQNRWISLTSFPSTTSFPSMIRELPLSDLWSYDAVTHVRDGGAVEYGFTISNLPSRGLFGEDFSHIQDQIYNDYLQSQPDWLGRSEICVSETLANGVYLLSGDTGRLEKLFQEGEKTMTLVVNMVNSQGKPRTNQYATVIKPFCLRDQE